jgi:subtilisin family serine protease
MCRPSSSRVARRARAAGVSATALALLGAVTTAAPSAASPAKPSGPGVSGWWYDALVVEEAHRETTGEGATVIVADGTIDTRVPELQGADIRLEKNCMGDRVESFTVPDAKHGTEMAALIVGTGKGTGPGGAGIAGVAPDARLHYYSLDFDPERPGISCKDDILPYMREALAQADGGAIVNWSVGNLVTDMEAFQREVEEAGGVSVAAAGDRVASVVRGQMDAPALYPGYVAVMALDESAQPWVDNPLPAKVGREYVGYPTISAPGVDISSLGWRDGGWVSGVPAEGTSYATALVSGALALVKSKYPEATGNQLIQHLIHFDTDPDTFEYSDEKGFGIVSLRNMLANDPAGWPDVNPILDGHPRRVVEKFPMSLYDPERARGTAEADASGVAADGETDGEVTDTEAGGTAGTDTEGGVPAAVWIGAGVVLLVLLGGAAVVARRRTSD